MTLSSLIGEGTLIPRQSSPPKYINGNAGSPGSSYEGSGGAHLQEEPEPLDDGQAPSELELDTDTPRLLAEKGDDLGEESSPLLALPPTTPHQQSESFMPRRLRALGELSAILMRRAGVSPASLVRGIKSVVLALKVSPASIETLLSLGDSDI